MEQLRKLNCDFHIDHVGNEANEYENRIYMTTLTHELLQYHRKESAFDSQ